MLDFVKNTFRGFIGVILWINLILFTVGGGFIGNLIARRSDKIIYITSFALVGVIIGLLSNIIFGGFIATIINIDKNIELLKNSNGTNGNILSEE